MLQINTINTLYTFIKFQEHNSTLILQCPFLIYYQTGETIIKIFRKICHKNFEQFEKFIGDAVIEVRKDLGT